MAELDAPKIINDSYSKMDGIDRGMVLSIQHPMMFEPATGVIQKVEGRNIYFQIPESFLRNNVLKGDNLIIQIFQDESEYVLEGMISEFQMRYPWNVQVYVDKVSKYKNKRKSKRFFINTQANIYVPSLDKNIYALIKNISDTGIGTIFRETMNAEELKYVLVSAAVSNNQILCFEAGLIRSHQKKGFNEYGFEITCIDDKNKEILGKFILTLQENESIFIAEYLK